MSDISPKDEAVLEDLFSQERADTPDPSPHFMARVLADAEVVQAGFHQEEIVERPGWFANALNAIGGWPTFAGLATATVAGVWIGFASPEMVDGLASGYLGVSEDVELTDLMPSFDDFLQEG